MDGVSGLADGASAIFPGVVVQRCMARLVRNSVRHVPSKHMREFCRDCKATCGAASREAAKAALETLMGKWSGAYPGAVGVWERNLAAVPRLFDYPSDIRRIMYTTNAIETLNSSLRKVTKKGMFESENAVFKVFYLQITGELEPKWADSKPRNWSGVPSQLLCLDHIGEVLDRRHLKE